MGSINGIIGASINSSLELAITMGQLPGFSVLDKFGENPDIDTGTVPEDIWEFGGTYNYDADGTAPIVSLISDNAADNQEIEITGLDIDGYKVTQTITVNGNTRVPLTTPLWRVYRMSNESDTGNNINGTIYCYVGTGGVPATGDVRAIIDNGNNQSLMALVTIPRGYVGYLLRGEVGGSRSLNTGTMQCAYYSRRYGKVFKIKKRFYVTNQGTSTYQDVRSAPDVIPSMTDIKFTVESVSSNNSGVFGTMDIIMIEEGKFPLSFLKSIGQYGV